MSHLQIMNAVTMITTIAIFKTVIHLPTMSSVIKYITNDLFSSMADMTNLYALQSGTISNFKQTTPAELQILFGLHILMGTLKFPRVRMYWDTTLKMELLLDSMPRNRFFQLRTNLHLVNSMAIPANNKYKFYKVRPIYTAIRNRRLELSMEEELAVDETMIPLTGKLSVKKYVKGKPSPWGIKIYMFRGDSGEAYDFILYQGASTEFQISLLKEFGQGVYFDNFFSSYKLFQALKQEKICAAGTVRLNRFANPPLIPDKEAMKKERGFTEEICSADDITLVKWVDNKTVVLGSNFIGKGEIDKVERWDKKESKYVTIDRPEIVKCYNHGMSGVDLFDQLMSYYRIFIKSKKWTLRAIFHAVDFAVEQSWLEYRKNASAIGLPTKKIMDLLHFCMKLADVLVLSGMDTSNRKRGRPSATPPDTSVQRRRGETRPPEEVQYDGTTLASS
ncbi:piggyBac transposable element-derived protein 3-like [Schistocerca serialis cubense]|uniref:piggyBac transposable element-derived protein 3-like n=1 Tax=Schistocerca serialis cubense TaxID=2023355 RepID=UPI00214EE659|nr:piggyBac transposable element-derived protein 3-like [Schistocerca serialis cubense]